MPGVRIKDPEIKQSFDVLGDAREKRKFNWRSAGVRDAVGQ